MAFRWIIVFALFVHTAFSQEQKIIGRVVEPGTEKPVRDANIIIPGTTAATFSNHLGYFELTVDRSVHSTLQISHISYKILQIPIPAQDRFKLYLEKDTVLLNAVNLNQYPITPTHADIIPTQNAEPGAELEAIFPSGLESFYTYMGNALAPALPNLTSKGFTILFTINETGIASDLVTSDPAESVKILVTEIFQKMPAWIPATQRQKKVNQTFKLPINRFDPQSLDFKDLHSFINRNIKYPAQAKRFGISGSVYVQFTTDAAGKVLTTNLLKGIDESCNAEVVRIVSILPVGILQLLSNQSQQHDFVLPVFFSLGEKPLKIENQVSPETNSLFLSPVHVLAGGLIVQRREVHGSGSISVPDVTYTVLHDAIKEGKGAKKLSLRGNRLASFPSDILTLTNLYYLDLVNNQLQTLPNQIDGLTDLNELYLQQNQLTYLPDNFGNLQKLKKLDLAINKLNSFPMSLIKLEKLETLDLTNNQLSSLPPEIGLMRNLKVLLLMNNKITSLPPEFFTLKKLEKIYLDGNPINANDIELLKKTFKKAEIGF